MSIDVSLNPRFANARHASKAHFSRFEIGIGMQDMGGYSVWEILVCIAI